MRRQVPRQARLAGSSPHRRSAVHQEMRSPCPSYSHSRKSCPWRARTDGAERESGSLTDTPYRGSPAKGQVRRPRPRSLQAGDRVRGSLARWKVIPARTQEACVPVPAVAPGWRTPLKRFHDRLVLALIEAGGAPGIALDLEVDPGCEILGRLRRDVVVLIEVGGLLAVIFGDVVPHVGTSCTPLAPQQGRARSHLPAKTSTVLAPVGTVWTCSLFGWLTSRRGMHPMQSARSGAASRAPRVSCLLRLPGRLDRLWEPLRSELDHCRIEPH